MAEVVGRYKWLGRGILEITWPNLANGDTGSPLTFTRLADKTVTARGTFGVGGSVTMKGTDAADGTATTGWDALNDSRGEGNAMTFTARDTKTLLENPGKMAPHVTAGDGTTSLTVVVTAVMK